VGVTKPPWNHEDCQQSPSSDVSTCALVATELAERVAQGVPKSGLPADSRNTRWAGIAEDRRLADGATDSSTPQRRWTRPFPTSRPAL